MNTAPRNLAQFVAVPTILDLIAADAGVNPLFVAAIPAGNLREQGFRFVLRVSSRASTWVHLLDVLDSDVDCTDMTDEQFESAVREWDAV